jgi:hypothetical protein
MFWWRFRDSKQRMPRRLGPNWVFTRGAVYFPTPIDLDDQNR